LIYLAHARLDISFPISVVSQFMHASYEEHLDVVYRIMRSLKDAPIKGLFFLEKPMNIMWLFLLMLTRHDPLQRESRLQVIVPTCGETW